MKTNLTTAAKQCQRRFNKILYFQILFVWLKRNVKTTILLIGYVFQCVLLNAPQCTQAHMHACTHFIQRHLYTNFFLQNVMSYVNLFPRFISISIQIKSCLYNICFETTLVLDSSFFFLWLSISIWQTISLLLLFAVHMHACVSALQSYVHNPASTQNSRYTK